MLLSTPSRLLFAILSLASAAVVRREASFSISEVVTNEGFLPSGPSVVRNTFLRYSAEPPSTLVARALVNATVEASPTQYDSEYLIPVEFGIPPFIASLSLDSNNLEVSVYDPALGKSGNVSTTVNIGGVVVTNQIVQLNNDPANSNSIGMSYLGLQIGPSFYTNAVGQGSMAPIYTADLNKGAPGTYGFGFENSTSYSGTITYVPVNAQNGFWEISGNGYGIGTGAFVTLAIDTIVDTGTTLIYLPQKVLTAYYAKVPGAVDSTSEGGYIFPCSATLPDLVLGISTYRATVPGSYLSYAPTQSGGSTCFGGLQSDAGIGFSIFGLTFIKSQFVVFKGTTSPTVGFAKKA